MESGLGVSLAGDHQNIRLNGMKLSTTLVSVLTVGLLSLHYPYVNVLQTGGRKD